MINETILSNLPLEFQKLEKVIKLKSENNSKVEPISIELLKTNNALKEKFYKPISKYLKNE